MTRFLFALMILVTSPVMAKDDGGFGTARFTAQAPVALGDGEKSSQLAVSQEIIMDQGVANIEPAAGVEKNSDIKDKETGFHESKHQSEPIIIQKDLEVR